MDIIQQTLKHSVWECKYHVVWIPKYRKKTLYGEPRKYLGEKHAECQNLTLTQYHKIFEGIILFCDEANFSNAKCSFVVTLHGIIEKKWRK